jgi:8-oxo-dGTP pyrophosphatase MutT (NUDIX family)
MKKLDIVQCVIEQSDLYFLQIRGSEPKIGAAGLIGCFGGGIKPGEKPLDAMLRELSEETNLDLMPDDLEFIGKVKAESDKNNEPVVINSEVFFTQVHGITRIEAKDGTLFPIHKGRVDEYRDKMTPATREVFKQLINQD